MKLFFETPPPGINAVNMSGYIFVANEAFIHDVSDMTLVLEASRCSLDLKNCVRNANFNIKDVCRKMADFKAAYSNIFEAFTPKIACAVPGNFTLPPTKLDLVPLKYLPLDGYVWILNFKLVYYNTQKKTKKNIMCMICELEISRGRLRT